MIHDGRLDDGAVREGRAVAVGPGEIPDGFVRAEYRLIARQGDGVSVLHGQFVDGQIGLRPHVPVRVLADRVNLPAVVMPFRDAEDPVLPVVDVVERGHFDGHVVAHRAVLGVVRVALIGGNGELRRAVHEGPRSDALPAIEGDDVVKAGAARGLIGAGGGSQADRFPQPGQRRGLAADAGDAVPGEIRFHVGFDLLDPLFVVPDVVLNRLLVVFRDRAVD